MSLCLGNNNWIIVSWPSYHSFLLHVVSVYVEVCYGAASYVLLSTLQHTKKDLLQFIQVNILLLKTTCSVNP